jgi:katanin p60 ATPase-containing subunit A1
MKTEMLTCMDGMASKSTPVVSAEETDGEDGESPPPANRMVMVLGATNQPWELDDAFKRRFEKRIYIPLPGAAERVTLFRLMLKSLTLGPDVDFARLAELTPHYSGADIAVVAKAASYAPMRKKQASLAIAFPRPEQIREKIAALKACEAEVSSSPIVMADFIESVAANKPSASHEGLSRFVEYSKEHGAS